MPPLSPFARLFSVRSRHWLAATVLLCASAVQAAPSGLLNDTGQTQCANATHVMGACDSATTGNAGTRPRQDGRFGRDAALPAKVGGGAAGFDFTKVCMNGTLNCATASDTGASPAPNAWACTRDNVTNLIWSLQSQGMMNWAAAGALTDSRCGYSSGWRLPTRRELLSIVHNGLTSGPMVDVNYFPATQSDWYWTSDTYAPDAMYAWFVGFDNGGTFDDNKTYTLYVRLVRAGP